jgi:hypothetical protein
MPLPLVRRILREVWDGKSALRPAQVYLFSRGLGVSYAAAAWQLTQHKLLRASDAKRLVKQGAAAAKTELRGMSWVNNARADVWVFDERMNGITIACRTGDELHLRLPEDLSIGRVWMVDEGPMDTPSQVPDTSEVLVWDEGRNLLEHQDRSVAVSDHKASLQAVPDLDLVYDVHLGPDGSAPSGASELLPTAEEWVLFGPEDDEVTSRDGEEEWPRLPGPGRRILVFVARTSGTFPVALSLRPAWDPAGPALATFNFTVEASARDRLLGPGQAAPQRDIRVKRLAAA